MPGIQKRYNQVSRWRIVMSCTYEQSLEATGVQLDTDMLDQIEKMKQAFNAHLEYCVNEDPYANPLDLPLGLAVTVAFNNLDDDGICHLVHSIESQIQRLATVSTNSAASKLAALLYKFQRELE
jgi:hypothetical protein